jgi:hypothetical protein
MTFSRRAQPGRCECQANKLSGLEIGARDKQLGRKVNFRSEPNRAWNGSDLTRR